MHIRQPSFHVWSRMWIEWLALCRHLGPGGDLEGGDDGRKIAIWCPDPWPNPGASMPALNACLQTSCYLKTTNPLWAKSLMQTSCSVQQNIYTNTWIEPGKLPANAAALGTHYSLRLSPFPIATWSVSHVFFFSWWTFIYLYYLL